MISDLGIPITIWNVLLFFLGCVAAAIVVVLIARWARNDPDKQRQRFPIALLLWWFMTSTPTVGAGATNTIATQGPFTDQAQCEWARSWVAAIRVVSSPCWSDGK